MTRRPARSSTGPRRLPPPTRSPRPRERSPPGCKSRRFRTISQARQNGPRVSAKGKSAMPSFDIVSRLDLAEVDNAVAGIDREIATRFDFKGSKCEVKREEGAISLVADDDLKLKQLHELLKVHLPGRKVAPAVLDFKTPEKASGNTIRQSVGLRQGVDTDLARRLVREIKDSKLKVQVAIQGSEL